MNGKFIIKLTYERDTALKNNTKLEVIPQIMTNDADEFLFVVKYIQDLGYKEFNWNLDCPYPMVINRSMESWLIQDGPRIEQILKRVNDETDVAVSMKMRIGKQLYKGGGGRSDLDALQRCVDSTSHKIYYNGDITSVEIFREMQSRFPSID